MHSIVEDIFREILRFVFCVVLGWFFFWTGEIVLTVASFGWHRPRWDGYSGAGALKWVFSETALTALGFAFWLATFPLAYDFFTNL